MKNFNNIFFKKGMNREIIHAISDEKKDPLWMREFRLKALDIFEKKPMPNWGPDLSGLDLSDIYFYTRPIKETQKNWDDVPEKIKKIFDVIGVPQAEKEFLAGVGAQYESELIYKNLKEEWKSQGVIFCDIETALIENEQLVKKYFSTVVPTSDNKFSALNSAVWSGGSFVYVPKNVKITMPLQAYFRINKPQMGQFERTLIITEPESYVHYVEGCSAPVTQKSSLHSAVVELIALENSHIRYTTIQNWSDNVYNLVTKRAHAYKNSRVEWIDGNFGSKVTMKYPSIILKESGAKGQVISIAVAKEGQHQDTGAKIIHLAPFTTSSIIAKSISYKNGRSSYRGMLKIAKGAIKSKSNVCCDALLLCSNSRSDTYPTMKIDENDSTVEHEAFVSKISEEKLWYLMSRGLTSQQAKSMIVNSFIDVFVKELPMEYALEINRLISYEMEDSVG